MTDAEPGSRHVEVPYLPFLGETNADLTRFPDYVRAAIDPAAVWVVPTPLEIDDPPSVLRLYIFDLEWLILPETDKNREGYTFSNVSYYTAVPARAAWCAAARPALAAAAGARRTTHRRHQRDPAPKKSRQILDVGARAPRQLLLCRHRGLPRRPPRLLRYRPIRHNRHAKLPKPLTPHPNLALRSLLVTNPGLALKLTWYFPIPVWSPPSLTASRSTPPRIGAAPRPYFSALTPIDTLVSSADRTADLPLAVGRLCRWWCGRYGRRAAGGSCLTFLRLAAIQQSRAACPRR
jgi:hypothetical protein